MQYFCFKSSKSSHYYYLLNQQIQQQIKKFFITFKHKNSNGNLFRGSTQSLKVDINILDQKEQQKCQEAFNAFDKNGSKRIEKEELRTVLEEMGQNPTEEELIKMISEVDQTQEGAICYEDFLRVIALQKQIQQKSEEEDIFLAYLAMGGDEAKTKSIDKQKLISVIKDEFKLTIDTSRLLKELDINGSEDIEYNEFKNLLTN